MSRDYFLKQWCYGIVVLVGKHVSKLQCRTAIATFLSFVLFMFSVQTLGTSGCEEIIEQNNAVVPNSVSIFCNKRRCGDSG